MYNVLYICNALPNGYQFPFKTLLIIIIIADLFFMGNKMTTSIPNKEGLLLGFMIYDFAF